MNLSMFSCSCDLRGRGKILSVDFFKKSIEKSWLSGKKFRLQFRDFFLDAPVVNFRNVAALRRRFR